MSNILLKSRVLFLFGFFISAAVHAQQFRFIYIQSENKQPFFVKMDKKVLNSSAIGYLIISKINNSNNKLTIGFPKNEWPELNVTVNLSEPENGYVLKNIKGKGWALIDMQTAKVAVNEKTIPAVGKSQVTTSATNANAFARILAEVVNDPSIAELAVVKEQPKLPLTTEAIGKVELLLKEPEKIIEVKEPVKETVNTLMPKEPITDIIKPLSEVEPAKVQESIVNSELSPLNEKKDAPNNVKTQIEKLAEDTTTKGLLLTYMDKAETDTVNVFIPIVQAVESVKELKKADLAENAVIKTEKVVAKADAEKKDIKFLDMELRNPNQKDDSGSVVKDDFVIKEKKKVVSSTVAAEPGKKLLGSKTENVMINSDCKTIATQNDFLQLRRKMAAESDEKEMLKAANRVFFKTCFTSEQIKNLSVLFIDEEERYKFFVAAFPHVSDSHNYDALEDQLTENYYKARFKAMVTH